MSEPAPPTVPAGWYADPQNPGQGRYWDGTSWTEHVHRPGQPAEKLRAPEGTDPNTVWIWILVVLPLLTFIPVLFIPWQDYFGTMLADPTNTSAALDAQLAFFTSPAYLGTIALSFLIYAGTVVLALLDYRELTSRGVPKPFHWALSFIPSYGYLVYVIGRSVVVKSRTDRGLGPLWLTIAIFVLSLVFSFVLVYQMMTAMYAIFDTYGYR